MAATRLVLAPPLWTCEWIAAPLVARASTPHGLIVQCAAPTHCCTTNTHSSSVEWHELFSAATHSVDNPRRTQHMPTTCSAVDSASCSDGAACKGELPQTWYLILWCKIFVLSGNVQVYHGALPCGAVAHSGAGAATGLVPAT
jgi:hypothetical protein